MRLSEYQGKKLLNTYGIVIPKGFRIKETSDVKKALFKLNDKAIIKAMVPVGGRGKAGFVKLVNGIDEGILVAEKMLGQRYAGVLIEELIIEEALNIDKEFYLSIILDNVAHAPMLMFSVEGGMDIEQIAKEAPNKIIKIPVHPFDGSLTRTISESLLMQGISAELARQVEKTAIKLGKMFSENDLIMAEINPLVVDSDGKIFAADCKLEMDDSAIFRHPEYEANLQQHLSDVEKKARSLGSTLITLGEGDVGVICNGAGMGMAIIDMLNFVGIKPVNFLDSGGGLKREKAKNLCKLMFEHKDIKALIINLWGSITLLDDVADGIIEALEEIKPQYLIVVRLIGNGMQKAMDKLEKHGVSVARVIATEDAIHILADKLNEIGGN